MTDPLERVAEVPEGWYRENPVATSILVGSFLAVAKAAEELLERSPVVEDSEGLGGSWCHFCDRQTGPKEEPRHEKWCPWSEAAAALANLRSTTQELIP